MEIGNGHRQVVYPHIDLVQHLTPSIRQAHSGTGAEFIIIKHI